MVPAHRLFTALLLSGWAIAPTAFAQSRGELLYATHCVACHSSEVHWRNNKTATDWTSLKTQVKRWQESAALAWSDDDILDVTRYLNQAVYHFVQTADRVSSGYPGPAAWMTATRP
jgi:mono/diheme cytochrome c family protein